MKITILLLTILFPAALFFTSSVTNSGGSAGGYTGSPRDQNRTCTECHTGNNQLAEGWITSNIPVEGFIPGQTYTITATAVHDGVVKFGFEVTSEDDAHNKKGTYVITNMTQTKLTNANKAVTHTGFGTTPSGNSKTWTFDWTAPEAGTGNITFFGAFNATNGNGNTSGDVVYVSTYTVTELGLGIGDDADEKLTIRAYPSPFTDHLNIGFGEFASKVTEIRLFALNGVMVYCDKPGGIMADTYRLTAGEIAPGIYHLSVLLADGRTVERKVVKR